MVDSLYKDTLDYWGQKDYWSVSDVLNLMACGVEHLCETEYGWLKNLEEKILQAVANNTITSKEVNGQTMMKRDSLVLWASKNLKKFPFEPSDFERVKAGRNNLRAKNTQLKVIGLLAKALAAADESNKKNGELNISAITDKCLIQLGFMGPEVVDGTGLKQANVRNIISQGLKNLTDE